HFATSPIEKRVESLVSNKVSLEKIGIKQLSISLLSLSLMSSVAIIQPSQIIADFTLETSAVCRVDEECQTTDCTNNQTQSTHNFTPLTPASFSFSSSY
ncbi:MAG: hypothetical protein COU72_05245, partial [Parcubacteria group bacterium CG10_big_fil_rev_8_21_14_0_10_41_35]